MCNSTSTTLCNQCKERPATIHFTQICGDKLTKQDYCEICGAEFLDRSHPAIRDELNRQTALRTLKVKQWEQILGEIVARDPRYPKAAYLFMQRGLAEAQRRNPTGRGHVSGADLLASLRELAVKQFGGRAKAILNGWGIHQCEDFGEIVLNLVGVGLLAKSETDSIADFEDGYDFHTAFPS